MSRNPPAQGQRLFHRMLFKVANEASAALFRARLFAVWILQRSRLLRSQHYPSCPQPVPHPVPSLSQPSPAGTPGTKGKRGCGGPGCSGRIKPLQGPSPELLNLQSRVLPRGHCPQVSPCVPITPETSPHLLLLPAGPGNPPWKLTPCPPGECPCVPRCGTGTLWGTRGSVPGPTTPFPLLGVCSWRGFVCCP